MNVAAAGPERAVHRSVANGPFRADAPQHTPNTQAFGLGWQNEPFRLATILAMQSPN
jgi:hypothetical protein